MNLEESITNSGVDREDRGDPGSSQFFLSLEDDLMRIFGSEKLDSVLQTLGLEKDESIQHPWITKALERAQKKVEGRNYEIRKSYLSLTML